MGRHTALKNPLLGFKGREGMRKRHVLEEEGTWVGRRGGGKREKRKGGNYR
jgi:hypothetical protein